MTCAELTEFLVRFRPADCGHDPTATRIVPIDSQALVKSLKQHGASDGEKDSEDHVQKLLNKSLDPQWPWRKLSVPDEQSTVKLWFRVAVGRPHSYAGGVTGRGTGDYVTLPLDDTSGKEVDSQGKFVSLKDAWRVDDEETEKEATS